MRSKKHLDAESHGCYIPPVTEQTHMTAEELIALMDRHGLTGRSGAEELARRVGSSWRTVYRWRDQTHAISRMAANSIRRAFATQQAHTSRVGRAARKSKTRNQK